MTPFTTPPKNVFHAQAGALFKRQAESETDQLLRLISIILQFNGNDSDLVDLNRVLGLEKFTEVVNKFDGRTVKFPTAEEIHETVVLAFCYYYKEVKQMTWEQIHEALPWEVSPVSYGTQIKKLSTFMKTRITEYFEGKKQ